MIIVVIAIIILFLVLLAWTWQSLGNMDNSKKIKFIVGGIIIVYIITFIIYTISKIGLTYNNQEAMKVIRTVFVILFTIVNSYIILPYIFRKIEQINNDEIKKEGMQKTIIIVLIIIVLLVIFETNYFAEVQHRIINK